MTPEPDPDDGTAALQPAVGPADLDVEGLIASDGPVVSGVLLAAGLSTRYGDENKLLQRLDGEPLVRHAARTLVEAALDEVVVVVGHEADRVRDALADLPVTIVDNPDYEQGKATSVRRGIDSLDSADAVVFALGDMPCISPGTVDLLVAAFRAGVGDPLAACYEGQRGNPVLFARRHFEELGAVEGEFGARHILLADDDAALVETADPGVRRDVDSPADLEEFRST